MTDVKLGTALTPFVQAMPIFLAFRNLMANTGSAQHSLVLLDVDNMAIVNAQQGMRVGDEVLRRVVSVSTEWAQPPNMTGYLAGDQIVGLLPNTGPRRGVQLIETLLAEISAAGKGLPLGVRLSASAGGTTCSTGMTGMQAVTGAATALQTAKANRGSVAWTRTDPDTYELAPMASITKSSRPPSRS